MRIYILPVHPKAQPTSQKFEYPVGNPDYGVEQDFLDYLNTNKDLMVDEADKADWHYLPIFWTRWHLNHNYAKEGLNELQKEANNRIITSSKTFTICQYDDGPIVNLGRTKIFLSSRKTKEGFDIPLLRNLHKLPLVRPRKKYLASFIGRLSTHPTRLKMVDALAGRNDVFINDGDEGQNFFVDNTLRSYIALCPRGYGGSSFRFYEAMQLGVAPILISERDTRPFKKFINWDNFSFYTNKISQLPSLLVSLDRRQLITKGREARKFYLDSLRYGKWEDYVIKELEMMN